MHDQVLTCWWQSHYPNRLSPFHMYSWCHSSAVDAHQHTDKIVYSFNEISNKLHQYHKIHRSSSGQTPFRKVFGTDTFHLPYKYDIISEPAFYHLCYRTNAALMMTFINNPFFSVTAPPVWLMCIPHVQRKDSWSVAPRSTWSVIPPHAAECGKTCRYMLYPCPSTTFVYNGCLSKLGHDECNGN